MYKNVTLGPVHATTAALEKQKKSITYCEFV